MTSIDLDDDYEIGTEVGQLTHWTRVAVFVALFLTVIALIAPGCASAHDHHHPELDNWYASLHNKNGFACCNKIDCHRTDAEMRKDGHWWARLGHQDSSKNYEWALDSWVPVPDEKIVQDDRGQPIPNPEGEAVICHSTAWMQREGTFSSQIDPTNTTIYCFVAPAQY